MAAISRLQKPASPSDASSSELKVIPIDSIDPNPENPRTVFRQDELEQLLESVNQYGVQVPISVYREGGRYVLIDGERRWRVSLKLNRRTIPALVQQKPTPLQNLLLMFNIHALREQWDLLTVAMKLPLIIDLLTKEDGAVPREPQLAERTGLPRAWIRRSKLLLEMPQEYRDMLLDELKKPKSRQRLSEDLFIEMERSLRTVTREMPDLVRNKDRVRRVLLEKYRDGVIDNLVHFRNIGKIARAGIVDADIDRAHDALARLFEKNDYSVQKAFQESVSDAYLERDVASRIETLLNKLTELEPNEVDEDLRVHLQSLIRRAQELLEGAE